MTSSVTEALDQRVEAEPAVVEPGIALLARTSVVFALGAVTGKLVGLALLPILTRLMTPEGYGSMDVLMTLGTAVMVVLMLGQDVAALRLWFDQPDTNARRTLVGTWLAIALGLTVPAGCIVAVASGAISAALFGTPDSQPAVLAIAVVVVAGTIQTIALTVLRAQGRAGWYAMISGGVLLLYGCLAVGLLMVWQADANAVLVAWASALSTSAAVGMLLTRTVAFGRPAAAAARTLMRLGLPIAPAVASSLVGDFLNRTILLTSAGAAEVAYFGVAWRFASAAGLALVGFQLAWQPRAYALGTDDRARVQLAADALWIVGIVCATVVGLAVVAPEVVPFLAGTQYVPALPALGFSLVAILAMALYLVASLPSAISKTTQDLGLAVGACVVTTVAVNLLLDPVLSSKGTAIAAATGQIVAVLVVGRRGLRRLRLPYAWGKLVRLVALSASVVLVILVVGVPTPARMLLGLVALAVIAGSVPIRETVMPALARHMR